MNNNDCLKPINLFCLSCLLLIFIFLLSGCVIKKNGVSNNEKKNENHVQEESIESNEQLNISTFLDITQEAEKQVDTQQTNIQSINYSFIQDNTLCAVSNQGVFFIIDLSSGDRKVYAYPEWAGFMQGSPQSAALYEQKRLLLDFHVERFSTETNSIDLINKTKQSVTEGYFYFQHLSRQRAYYMLTGPQLFPYNRTISYDLNLKHDWLFPSSSKEKLDSRLIWEYKEVCHVVCKKDDTKKALLHICLDPNSGKELFREVLQDSTKNGIEVIQNNDQVWIQGSDEKGLYIASYRINTDHMLYQQWKRYYTDKPLTNENFLKDDDKDGLQYIDNRGKPYLIMPISYNKQESDQYKYESELICINTEDGSVYWTSEKILCSSLHLYPTNQNIIVDLGINAQMIGMEPKHDFLCLHWETGKLIWKKTITDEYLEEMHRRKLQISSDQDSLLVWNHKENTLTKILAKNGRTISYQFDKQATYFIEFLQADQHTYFQLDTWNKENSELLKSVVYKVE